MSGIYIHIPFCKQACHYCDFHFSTSLKKKEEIVLALVEELTIRRHENSEPVETIYFGGGTPSLLADYEIDLLLDTIFLHYEVTPDPEITLEANPDDLNEARIISLANSRVNRLSIGVQSFFEDDLRIMNRAHNAAEAIECLKIATQYFDNISVDLIYGIPGMSDQKWQANVEKALSFNIPHISSYALTVEPKTALEKMIGTGQIAAPEDETAAAHFNYLVKKLESEGFIHYELSNFGKPGYFSKNNSAYWLGRKYIGIGPSAHSFDGESRSWNIANNSLYLKALNSGTLPSQTEKLTLADRYNEYVMTGLRTIWGVSLEKINTEFGDDFLHYLRRQSQPYIIRGYLKIEENVLTTTTEGKFLADGIASDLFLINLDDHPNP